VLAGQAGGTTPGLRRQLLEHDEVHGHDHLLVEPRSGEASLPDAVLGGECEPGCGHCLAEPRHGLSRVNLFWAFPYNVAALPLAAAG